MIPITPYYQRRRAEREAERKLWFVQRSAALALRRLRQERAMRHGIQRRRPVTWMDLTSYFEACCSVEQLSADVERGSASGE